MVAGSEPRIVLRRGNHNSAKFWRRVLFPVLERCGDRDIPKYFGGDAAFAILALCCVLEEEGFSAHHPHPGQRRSDGQHQPSVDPSGGTPFTSRRHSTRASRIRRRTGDLREQRSMLRGDAARPWFRRRERPNRRLGVPGGRSDGRKQGQDGPFSLESGGLFAYDCGLRFDGWEIPVDRQVSPFIVGEPNPLTLELVLQGPVLLLNVDDYVLLLPVESAGQSHEKKFSACTGRRDDRRKCRVSADAIPGTARRPTGPGCEAQRGQWSEAGTWNSIGLSCRLLALIDSNGTSVSKGMP